MTKKKLLFIITKSVWGEMCKHFAVRAAPVGTNSAWTQNTRFAPRGAGFFSQTYPVLIANLFTTPHADE